MMVTITIVLSVEPAYHNSFTVGHFMKFSSFFPRIDNELAQIWPPLKVRC